MDDFIWGLIVIYGVLAVFGLVFLLLDKIDENRRSVRRDGTLRRRSKVPVERGKERDE